MNALKNYFGIDGKNTTVKTEILAGLTTFLTMVYIIFVNPAMLAKAGMDQGAVFVATCLAATVGCLIMGVLANLPVALAPGMGLNAFFTYGVVLGMGHSWQTALGAVFLSGCIFLFISLFKIREWMVNTIPNCLKLGIVGGIGAFLAFIAFQSSGIIVDHPATLVTLGPLTFSSGMAVLSFLLIAVLSHFRVPGSITLGILTISIISLLAGHTTFTGIVSMPPSIKPTLIELDIAGAFDVGMISVIFAFLFVDLFDTSGTLIAVTKNSGLINEKGDIKNLNKAMIADSGATVAGSLLGTSSVTSYVESSSGVAAGGRTGLVAVVAGLLFLLALFFSPLASMIPVYATAGAILYVATLMMGSLAELDWSDLTESIPGVMVVLLTPLTYSIAHGIALGFITYTALKVCTGKFKEVPISIWILTLILLLKVTGLLDTILASFGH